jgi:hypothetical protein
MKTNNAFIMYDPLSISFSILELGGTLDQKKDKLTGLFSPDRATTPLILRPQLKVIDPEGILTSKTQSADFTSSLFNHRWFANDERILSTTPGYTLGNNGELVVAVNAEPGTPINLKYCWNFTDARTHKVFGGEQVVSLVSIAVSDLNLSLKLDAALIIPISPFKNLTTRVINATFRNGETDIADSDAHYEWQVQVPSGDSKVYRAITTDDIFYVSGQGTKSLTIDRRYIDKEFIMLEAYHVAESTRQEYARTKLYRDYGLWEDKMIFLTGRYIRYNTKSVEIQTTIETPKGNIANPSKYFNIEYFYKTEAPGDVFKSIGYGEALSMPRNKIGYDPNVRPVWGIEVKPFSALRATTINGKAATINGKVLCIQKPL